MATQSPSNAQSSPSTLTRGQLKSLIMDGLSHGRWNSREEMEAVAVQLAQCQPVAIAMGDIVNWAQSPLKEPYVVMVLQGRIRVLGSASPVGADPSVVSPLEEQQILCHLIEGDVWEPDSYQAQPVTLLTSSANGLLLLIPRRLVEEAISLSNQWLSTQRKLDGAISAVASRPAPVSMSIDEDPTLAVLQLHGHATATQPVSPAIHGNNAFFVINQVLAYFDQPALSESVLDQEPKMLSALAQRIEDLGFSTRHGHLTYAQILNLEFPFVLEDQTGRFRWITSRSGNALIEETEVGPSRFVPANMQGKSHVLFVEKLLHRQGPKWVRPFGMAWYIRLLTKNPLLTSQMILGSVLVQFFSIGLPFFNIVIFDRVFGHQNMATLDVMTIGMFTIIAFDTLVKVLRNYGLNHKLDWVDRVTIDTFLQQVMRIPLSRINPDQLKGYAEQLTEIVKFNQVLVNLFLISSFDVVFSMVLVAVLMMLSPKLTAVALLPLLPIAAIHFWMLPRLRRSSVDFSIGQRQAALQLSETLADLESVQSLNANQLFKWRLENQLNRNYQKSSSVRFHSENANSAFMIFNNIGSVLTLFVGAHEVLLGNLSFGIYIAINMLGRQVVGTFSKLLTQTINIQDGVNALENCQKLFDDVEQRVSEKAKDQEGQFPVVSLKGGIVFDTVSFRYRQNLPWILQDMSLVVRPGEKVVVCGKSGAGKTTLLRLLHRLYTPSSGYIQLDNVNIGDYNTAQLREKIGLVKQNPTMFAGTIRENLLLAKPSALPEELVQAVSLSMVDHEIFTMPLGFESPVTGRGLNLSGGQLARLALARTLLKNPDVLIVDECLSAVEPSVQSEIFSRLFDRFAKNTCIFVSDFIPVHQVADRIIVLHEGKIVEQGTYAQLMAERGYYYHLYETASAIR